jgi:branched-chain amino acid transport system ATP-binding protein
MSEAPEPVLSLRGVTASLGDAPTLCGIDIEVYPGEVVALLGANGSGKTTTLRTVMGLVETSGGSVGFRGAELDGLTVEERAKLGIAYLPEGRRVFPGLSVYDNLAVACEADPDERRRRIDEIVELFFPLKERINMPAWRLSGGLQQMTAIGRALMSDPLLMMLDEPSVGLAPAVLRDVLARLRVVASRGTAILLAEQNAIAALGIADRAYVLDHGTVSAAGLAADFLIESAQQAAPTLVPQAPPRRR